MGSPQKWHFLGLKPGYVMDTGGQHSTTRDTALIFFMVSGAILSAPVQMQPLGMLGKAVILEAGWVMSLMLTRKGLLSGEKC